MKIGFWVEKEELNSLYDCRKDNKYVTKVIIIMRISKSRIIIKVKCMDRKTFMTKPKSKERNNIKSKEIVLNNQRN